jgi:hypothetical protein
VSPTSKVRVLNHLQQLDKAKKILRIFFSHFGQIQHRTGPPEESLETN